MTKVTIGVDIGSEDTKIVCLEKGLSVYKLKSYGIFSHRGNEDWLKAFILDANLPKGEVRINIEDPSLKIRKVDLPQMTGAEMGEAVKWALKDVLSGDPKDFTFKFIVIDNQDLVVEGKIPLLVLAIRTSAISERYALAKRIGLRKPKIIEPNAVSLFNLFEACKGGEREGPQGMVDLGRFSPFIVIGKKGLVFSRPLSGCSEFSLVEQLSKDLGIELSEAEDLRKKYVKGEEIDDNVKGRFENSISRFFSQMAIEIQRSIDGYNLVFGRQKLSHIHLCGGGAYMKGLIEYLHQTLRIGVSVFDPFARIDTSEFSPGPFDNKRAIFAAACGLAVD